MPRGFSCAGRHLVLQGVIMIEIVLGAVGLVAVVAVVVVELRSKRRQGM